MRVFTRQSQKILDVLKTEGVYLAREAFIRDKNQEITDFYLSLYRWLSLQYKSRSYAYAKRIEELKALGLLEAEPNQDFLYPIWLALSEAQKLPLAEGTVSLELEVPDDELLILDYNKWGYRVNHLYIPKDSKDRQAHLEELERQGIKDESALSGSKGNFYPLLKQKIIKSWDRVFDEPDSNIDNNVGVCFEIRPSWLISVEHGGLS